MPVKARRSADFIILQSIFVIVHTCPKSRTDANCNGIQPIGSSPLAKGWMPGKPHSLALFRQQVPEQGVNSNVYFTAIRWFYVLSCNWIFHM